MELKKKMRAATGERHTAATPRPIVIEYHDHSSAKTDKILTPGSIGEIKGENLKFNQSKDAEGIVFINAKDGVETRVQTLSLHTEGRLMLLVPDELAAGKYTLEVRRAYTSPTDMRTGRLNKKLSVTAS